jgi:hypothetical protein
MRSDLLPLNQGMHVEEIPERVENRPPASLRSPLRCGEGDSPWSYQLNIHAGIRSGLAADSG